MVQVLKNVYFQIAAIYMEKEKIKFEINGLDQLSPIKDCSSFKIDTENVVMELAECYLPCELPTTYQFGLLVLRLESAKKFK